MSECLFCKIAKGEIPANIVYEDENCVAFEDIAPQAPVHILVIPREHYSGIHEVPTNRLELFTNIFKSSTKVIEIKKLSKVGYRIVSNFGDSAGQTVPHIHLHILSGRDFQWPPG